MRAGHIAAIGALLAGNSSSVDIFDAPHLRNDSPPYRTPGRSRKYRPPGTTKSVETTAERKRRRKLERQRRKAGRNQR